MAASRPLRVHVVGRRAGLAWGLGFAAIATLLLARNLVDLSGSPPGLYVDEASIGYNAWAIAHFGVDEHGVRLPLYFEAFGEFKNPVYVYALVPFVRFLPLTPAVERLPAALFGAAAVAFLTLAAWRLTRSRPITLFTLALAGLTPWLAQESRVGFEVISMVSLLSGALWCLSGEPITARRFGLAGVFLALAVYGYSTGRLEVALFVVAFALTQWSMRPRPPKWWLTLVPVAAAYLVLGAWSLLNPGTLTGRFGELSIAADGAPFPVLLARFLANYVLYFDPRYLLVHGDLNPRHNTGYAGMLLAVTAPLLLAGLWVCRLRIERSLPRFLLLCLLLGPFAAALTDNGGMPHGLRSADMLPFWLLLAVLGMDGIARLTRAHPRWRIAATAVLGAGLAAQGALYTADMFASYPGRAAGAFDAGEEPAMTAAEAALRGHTIYLSTELDEPYIEAFFALPVPPPQRAAGDASTPGLARLHMVLLDPEHAELVARSGDVLVLEAADPRPSDAVLVVSEPGGFVTVYRVT